MKNLPYLFLLFFYSFEVLAQAKEEENRTVKQTRGFINTDNVKIASDNPLDSLTQNIDAFDSKLQDLEDSLDFKTQNLLPDSLLHVNPLDSLSIKIRVGQQKVNNAVDSLQQKLSIKVPDSLKQLIPEEASLAPGIDIPELDTNPLQKVGEITEVEELKSLQEIQDISNINQLDELQDISEIEELDAISEQAQGIRQKLSKTENLSETAKNEARNLKGMKALEAQKGEITEITGEMNQFKDQEHYKEELVNRAKEKAVDHFAGHADKLQAAQSKLADIKRKYPEGVSSIKDLPKRKPNPLKGKPFKERLVLGLTVQIHPDKIPNVDLSPFAAYKISPRLSFGLGGNYRLVSKPKFRGLTNEGAVYGYRGFSELMVHKGFFLHAEYEMLKTLVRDSIHFGGSEKMLEKEWIDGLLLGIGKEYKIGGLVKGNMQVLYNFLNEPNSPYKEKVMVRFGFSFQLKDKIKKPDLAPEVERAKGKGKRSLRKLKDENLSGSLK